MTLPGWGRKVLLLAIIPVPRLAWKPCCKGAKTAGYDTVANHVLTMIMLKYSDGVQAISPRHNVQQISL